MNTVSKHKNSAISPHHDMSDELDSDSESSFDLSEDGAVPPEIKFGSQIRLGIRDNNELDSDSDSSFDLSEDGVPPEIKSGSQIQLDVRNNNKLDSDSDSSFDLSKGDVPSEIKSESQILYVKGKNNAKLDSDSESSFDLLEGDVPSEIKSVLQNDGTKDETGIRGSESPRKEEPLLAEANASDSYSLSLKKESLPEDSLAVGHDVEGAQQSPDWNGETSQAEGETKKHLDQEENKAEDLRFLASHFSEEQLKRYEVYRRSAFNTITMRKLIQSISGHKVAENVVTAIAAIAKEFVGEVVEEALDVKDRNEETGPLQPKHLREATRRLKQRGAIPRNRKRPALFLH